MRGKLVERILPSSSSNSCGRRLSGSTSALWVPAPDSTRWRSTTPSRLPGLARNAPFAASHRQWPSGARRLSISYSWSQREAKVSSQPAQGKATTTTLTPPPTTTINNINHRQDPLEARFYTVLQNGQPDQLMDMLTDPRFTPLIESMPNALFTEAFHLLSPDYFVVPYREIHRCLHPHVVNLKKYKSLDSIFNDFATNLATIVRIRRSAGPLGLAEYTHLLDCARAIGDGLMADHVWHNLKEDGVIPDLKCYNYYMEAKVWDGAYSGLERYRLRVTPFAYRKRRYPANAGWKGYGTAVRSVRKEVLQIFNEMLEQGTYGDETSFVNVMLASCRVGHMRGVKNVLRTVWNVDVDAIVSHDGQSELPRVTEYPRSSPLYPTSNLLFAIAHVFGTNNDLPGALRTIDFLATAYKISIPESVWHELLERAFILSRRRWGSNADRNIKGQVSQDFFNGMFQTMSAGPFNVRPNINTHRMLAKTAWEQNNLPEFHHHMNSAYELLKETRKQRKAARSVVETYLNKIAAVDATSPQGRALLQSREFAEAVHIYDLHRLRTLQHTIVMERLAKLAFIHHRWTARSDPTWEHVLLPLELEEWRDFLPESFDHPLPTGRILFEGRTSFENSRLTPHRWVPIRRPPWGNRIRETTGLDDEFGEIDDDFVWEEYKRKNPQLNLSFAPLSRLFNGVGKRVHATTAGIVPVASPQVDEDPVPLIEPGLAPDRLARKVGVKRRGSEMPLGGLPAGLDLAFH